MSDETSRHLCRTCRSLTLATSGRHPAILGECGWQPTRVPHWVESWLDDDSRYGPKRTVWADSPVSACDAWSVKLDVEPERLRVYNPED